jgi:hypothetical protein
VVLGDFDATPDSASLSFLRGRRPVDGLSVCYLVRDCRRILDAPVDGMWASDHDGVLADLALPAQPPGFRS